MSFYNADPRAYFYIYQDVTWDSVWNKNSTPKNWKNTIDNYEIGRLIRIKNGESKSSADYNNQIFVVEYGKNDIIYDKENHTSNEQLNHKYLKPLNLTNPYSMAIGENTNANQPNQTVVGKNNTDSDHALFIVGNGPGSDEDPDHPTGNAFEVLDGSEGNEGIKINGTRVYIDGDKFYVGSTEYGAKTTISGELICSDTSQNGVILGKISVGGVQKGVIRLPTTISQSTTIAGNLQINGTTALQDDVTIASTKKLTTKEIVSNFTPTGASNSLLALNTNGNTKIGETISTSGTKKQSTTGLQFGNYNISIVTKSEFDSLTKQNNTLYFVIEDPSNNYSS